METKKSGNETKKRSFEERSHAEVETRGRTKEGEKSMNTGNNGGGVMDFSWSGCSIKEIWKRT